MSNNRLIIMVLALALTMGIGYALLSDTITVTGTASTTGTFDIQVDSASVITEVGSTESTITISSDKNTVNINVPKLQYPGAYTTFSITLKNVGTVPTKLKDIVENALGDSEVEVTYSGITEQSTLAVNGSTTFTVKAEWKTASTQASAGANIDIDFVYEQNV